MRTNVFLTFFLLLAAQSASAQLGHYYGALSLGTARIEANQAPNADSDFGSAFSIDLGYRFTTHLAAEVSYFSAAAEAAPTRMSTANATTVTDFRAKTRGPGVALVGILPTSPWFSIFGKAGVRRMHGEARTTRTTFDETGVLVSEEPTVTWSAWMPVAAVGIQIGQYRAKAQATIERVRGSGGLDRATTVSFGVAYEF